MAVVTIAAWSIPFFDCFLGIIASVLIVAIVLLWSEGDGSQNDASISDVSTIYGSLKDVTPNDPSLNNVFLKLRLPK